MSKLDDLIKDLIDIKEDRTKITEKLQEILEYMIQNTRLVIKINNKEIILQFLELEAYYNGKNFLDPTVHQNEHQKANFSYLYIHRHPKSKKDEERERPINRAGMDLCLSDGEYYFSVLIRGAYITPSKGNPVVFRSAPAKLVDKIFHELDLDYIKENIEDLEKTENIIDFVEKENIPVSFGMRKGLNPDKTKDIEPSKEKGLRAYIKKRDLPEEIKAALKKS